jgi:hypothetical protein
MKLPWINSNNLELKRLTKSLAVLDAILMPEWEFRYYSFNSQWSEKEEMASMRNGSGDHYFILYSKEGLIAKGFAKESKSGIYCLENNEPWPMMLSGVPDVFHESFLKEPAFLMEETSFLYWRLNTGKEWQTSVDDLAEGDNGAQELLRILDGNPETYWQWAESYYQRTIPLEAVAAVHSGKPLTDQLIQALNPSLKMIDLKDDLDEIGY